MLRLGLILLYPALGGLRLRDCLNRSSDWRLSGLIGKSGEWTDALPLHLAGCIEVVAFRGSFARLALLVEVNDLARSSAQFSAPHIDASFEATLITASNGDRLQESMLFA